MVTVTSQGDPPGTGGKSQKSFIGRTLQRGGIPAGQGEFRGERRSWGDAPREFGGAQTDVLELLVGTAGFPQNCPSPAGAGGVWGGSAAPPCAWSAGPRTQSGNRARTRPRNLEPGAVGGCRWDPSNPDPAQDETGNPLLQNSTGIQFPWRLQTGHAAPDPKGDAGRDPPAPDHRSQRRWDPSSSGIPLEFASPGGAGGVPLLQNSIGIPFPRRRSRGPPA